MWRAMLQTNPHVGEVLTASWRISEAPAWPHKRRVIQRRVQRGTKRRFVAHAPSSHPHEQTLWETPGENQERLVDLTEFLNDSDEEALYEDSSGSGEDIWEHEQRFVRPVPGDRPETVSIKGALDPEQADILSAYSPEQGFQEIGVQTLASRLAAEPSLCLIDVRTPEEYSEGQIAGSRNVSLDRLSQAVKAGELQTQAPLAVICAKGGRSAQACVRLSKVFNFENVTNVKGGMSAWTAAGLPVQT